MASRGEKDKVRKEEQVEADSEPIDPNYDSDQEPIPEIPRSSPKGKDDDDEYEYIKREKKKSSGKQSEPFGQQFQQRSSPFNNFMGQNFSGATNVHAIQIGYANKVTYGNTINYHNCKINSSQPSPNRKTSVPKKENVPSEILCRKDVVTKEILIKVRDAHIGYKWRPLGISLNIAEGDLDNIQYMNRDYGLDEMVYKVLIKWTQNEGSSATIGMLAKALEEVDLVKVATKMVQGDGA